VAQQDKTVGLVVVELGTKRQERVTPHLHLHHKAIAVEQEQPLRLIMAVVAVVVQIQALEPEQMAHLLQVVMVAQEQHQAFLGHQ
jgi:hypothetical protein